MTAKLAFNITDSEPSVNPRECLAALINGYINPLLAARPVPLPDGGGNIVKAHEAGYLVTDANTFVAPTEEVWSYLFGQIGSSATPPKAMAAGGGGGMGDTGGGGGTSTGTSTQSRR